MKRATVEWKGNNVLVDATVKWGVPLTKRKTTKLANYTIDRPLVPWMLKFIETTHKIDKVLIVGSSCGLI